MRPPQLADAADPLGQLQRGLGSGYLWALDASPAVAGALLVHCLFNDPRWDLELDDRDDYHATLALDIGLDVAPLEGWLRGDGDEDRVTTRGVLGALGRMAIRGHAEASRVLRDYVAYGASWLVAIERLIDDYDAMPGVPWPEAVAGLDAVVVERFAGDDGALVEALAGVDRRSRPWTLWSVENPEIARALAYEHGEGQGQGARRAWRPRRRDQPKPHELTTAELLAIAESSRWTQIADELEARTSAADVELLVAAAHDPQAPMRHAAILALGRQGRRELLAIAEAHSQAERSRLQGAIALALEAMPASQTRTLAHDWLRSPDWARRRKAAGILATHADPGDLQPVRDALTRELDAGLDADVYVIALLAEALERLADGGPFDELLRAYQEIPYSYGRRHVVAALAASDPTFAGDVAVECLWDCERETRALAATHVDRRIRLAAQRLEELANDGAQAATVRQAAARNVS